MPCVVTLGKNVYLINNFCHILKVLNATNIFYFDVYISFQIFRIYICNNDRTRGKEKKETALNCSIRSDFLEQEIWCLQNSCGPLQNC